MTITGLSPGTQYNLCVKAENPAGVSACSYPVQFTTLAPPPAITGPTLICSGSPQDFTASNAPQGFTWDKSSNLTLTGTGSSVSVDGISNSPTYHSLGWVAIKSSTGEELVRYPVWVGTPALTLSGPDKVRPNSYPQYTGFPVSGLSNPTNYSWSINPVSGNYLYQGTYWANVMFNVEGWYQVMVYASNTCGQGTSRLMLVEVSDRFYSPAYPNPASDILNIDIDTQPQSSAPAITTGTQLKTDKTYDLRLYDTQGTLLRNAKTKGGTVQFNVQNLPDGIYYLHIYDGVNPKPEMQQIVVEH